MNGANGQLATQMIILVVFIVLMYFILIKPQKKKEKEVQDMRSNIQVGDEIVTIGGICGRVVKTKDDSIVIQVGADKTKFEVKKWAISTVEKKSTDRKVSREEIVQEQEEKKVKPKRLLGKKATSMEEEAAALAESAPEIASDAAAEVADAGAEAATAVQDAVQPAE